jgi:hypothetical protein
VEDDVLAGNTSRELTVDLDAHVLTAAGNEGLGCEDVLDFTGSDTEGEGTESTVGGGMAVTADDGCAGQGETLLWADNMDDTLALVTHSEIGEAKVLHVLFKGGTLQTRIVFLDEVGGVLEIFP